MRDCPIFASIAKALAMMFLSVAGCTPGRMTLLIKILMARRKRKFRQKNLRALKDNPSGTGSSKAFEASQAAQPLVSKNIFDNSFSFALQNVTDEVPQRVLPTEVPLLTLVTNDSQDADIPPIGNNFIPIAEVTKALVDVGSHLHLEHVDVQEEPIDVLVDTSAVTDTQATQAASKGTTTNVDNVDREVSPTVQLVDTEGAELEDINRPVIVREEGMTHINPRIQHDLDIWHKIKDYDKRAAENPFEPVLSKKKKQMLKKHQFDGKAPYKTRSTGQITPPS